MTQVLLKFNHGLGDCVQFTSVIEHLKKYKPEWSLTFLTNPGKETVAIGLCDFTSDSKIETKKKFDKIFNVKWYECHNSYEGMPSTKVEKCLKEEFSLTPDLELLKYKQTIREETLDRVRGFFDRLDVPKLSNGRYASVILHYQGNTSSDKKNLTHEMALLICNHAILLKRVPIILDWDSRSPLPDNERIFCPDKHDPIWNDLGTGDAETIAAIIYLSDICIGIDSGPGHIAATTHTPTLIYWNKHHPIHYFTTTSNVTHMVPKVSHMKYIRGDQSKCFNYFNDNYRYIEYVNPTKAIFKWMDYMTGNIKVHEKNDNYLLSGDFWIRRDNAEQDMVIVKDIYHDDAYKLKIIPGIIKNAKLVIDIGAHIGVFTKYIHKLNPSTKLVAVEVCPENVPLLKLNCEEFATIIQAACTYETEELILLNAVRPNCESTGGSIVVPKNEETISDLIQEGYKYWPDYRPIQKITLEDILTQIGRVKIDILKLDCEGAEYSILGNTTSLDNIRFILGEYHNKEKWDALRKERFPSSQWDYGVMFSNTQMGNFHLYNKKWTPE